MVIVVVKIIIIIIIIYFGGCNGENTRLPTFWPVFKFRRRHHKQAEFVVGSPLRYEGVFPGIPVFPSPQKPTFPNWSSTRNQADAGAD